MVYNVQCTVYSVHCTLYSVRCAMCNVRCTVYSVQCTACIEDGVKSGVWSVQWKCAVCSVQFASVDCIVGMADGRVCSVQYLV